MLENVLRGHVPKEFSRGISTKKAPHAQECSTPCTPKVESRALTIMTMSQLIAIIISARLASTICSVKNSHHNDHGLARSV
jgi:hypothetical protein